MKIGYQAIKQVYDQAGMEDFLPEPYELAKKIGAQLGEIEHIEDWKKKYEGIVVAKVIKCEDHPDADKLRLCKIDDGGKVKSVERDGDGLVQVVCGAPNVTEGMLVAWLPPGNTVPATADKDPLVLEARKIRGKTSYGMLASPSELGISDDQDGILSIDKKAEPGDDFAKLYKLDTYIFEIENKMFTHRPDCFGLLGIAREIAGIYGKQFSGPEWYVQKPEFPQQAGGLDLKVENEIPELVPRFCTVVVADIKVGPSPLWMQVMLSKFGVKSINNIVDMTNFYMLFTGQPLHAYDYDKAAKLSGKTVTIRTRKAEKGEKLKLLNGKEAIMNGSEIMIATDKHPIGIGGVIGGSETEVDADTRNIILECANFDSYSIRRTSMAHGIFTDAVTRFTKGQSPHQNLAVLAKITNDLIKFTGAKIAAGPFDLKGKLKPNEAVNISADFINSRLGLKLSAEEISRLLINVEFEVEVSGKGIKATAPFWRTDIEIPEDIVEEIGRLYGYDHLKLELPKKPMAASRVSEDLNIKQKIRERLAALGANEVLGYSFVKGGLLDTAGQDRSDSFKIKNALSPELEYYRQSLTPSLLEKVHPNIKLGFDEFSIFELGKVHIKGKETGGLPEEFDRIALVVTAKGKKSQPAFYAARKYLVELLAELGIAEECIAFESSDKSEDSASMYYLDGRSALIKVGGELIGRIGEYNQKITTRLKLPEYCAGFEIGLKPLIKLQEETKYQPLSRYPSTDQDICLKTSLEKPYSNIRGALAKALEANVPEDVSVKLSCIDIFSGEKTSKQTTFRITASSYQRTLTSEIMNLLFEKSAPELKKLIDADIV